MTPLVFDGFLGANTALDPKLLHPQVGVVSLNQKPGKGDLRPWKTALAVATVPSSRLTIYRMGRDAASDSEYWLSFTDIAHLARDFDATDTTERTLITRAGSSPKWTNNVIGLASSPYPTALRELAVPAPLSAATVALNVQGSDGTESAVSYVHTFVNELGWESAPSPPSAELMLKPGATVNISNLEAAPSGAYGITARRIYKLQTGTSGSANYFFLREIAIGTTSTTDDARALGAQIATTTVGTVGSSWVPPPSDLRCLTLLWNSMLAGISGRSVRVCEPGKGYAWPERYANTIADTPVALGTWGQWLAILTTGDVYLASGSDPMGLKGNTKGLKFYEPCASVRSVCSMPSGTAWASPRGLCWVGDSGAKVLTDGLIEPATWAGMTPSTMVASHYLGLLFVFYTEGGVRKGLCIDPLNPTAIYYLSAGYDAAYHDPIAKAMYVLEGTSVKKFDFGAALMTATARSKLFRHTSARSYARMEVVADAYPVAVKVWADGELIAERSIANDDDVTLPDRDCEDWQVEASTGVGSVQAVRMGLNADDLR